MNLPRKLGITAILLWTFSVTALRAIRPPNDFAEAHWLLDYRFGFVRRGFIGTIVTLATKLLHVPISEQLIRLLSGVAFLIFSFTIIFLSYRIIHRSGWSATSVMAAIVFLSSPFVVMSAHLFGYFDNIVIVMAIISIFLIFKGRIWIAAFVQALAIFIHETSLFVGFPLFCLAWLLDRSVRQREKNPVPAYLPLLLPVLAFVILSVSQYVFVAGDFREAFTARLSNFPFIESYRSKIPLYLSTTFLEYYAFLRGASLENFFKDSTWRIVLPSVLLIISCILGQHRIRLVTVESLLLFGVCFAPQFLHLVAWDASRIWTYSIICSFIALWIYSELFTATDDSSIPRFLCLVALAVNVFGLTPLLDEQSERLTLGTRLYLYAPVMAASLALVFYGDHIPIAERFSIRGVNIFNLPARRNTDASAPAKRASAKPPKR